MPLWGVLGQLLQSTYLGLTQYFKMVTGMLMPILLLYACVNAYVTVDILNF